jgi:hypothetical protein
MNALPDLLPRESLLYSTAGPPHTIHKVVLGVGGTACLLMTRKESNTTTTARKKKKNYLLLSAFKLFMIPHIYIYIYI